MNAYIIRLYTGRLLIDAETEEEARAEALQAIIESPDLLSVGLVREEQSVAD